MPKHPAPPHRHALQQGVTLIFALVTLAVLMLATLALVRSVDSGSMLMANIGYKQDATASGDQATLDALAWLNSNQASLNSTMDKKGYYASTMEIDGTTVKPPIDATGGQMSNTPTRQLIDWDGDGCASATANSYSSCDIKAVDASSLADKGNSNTARYVIFRMCNKDGDYTVAANDIVCVKPPSASSNSSSIKGELNYAESTRFGSSSGPYYRIVVRIKGARNTVSYTETIVHF
jgi:type IV pilus assembly protein PilX